MKMRNINILIAIAGLFIMNIACQREDLPLPDENGAQEGYKTIEFYADVPDMAQVQTKAVDPDGAGVQKMTVFCFDANSLFITTVSAVLSSTSNGNEVGIMKVTVPDHTEVMQLVGNQNLDYFKEDSYRGRSEIEVMSQLEASAGRMIYWARSTVDDLPKHNSAANAIELLRNQAKITLNVETDFQQKGWVVVNSNAFGTIAPFNSEYGGFVAPTLQNPFVTIPDNNAKLGDFLDVRTNDEEYIFETENTDADPIDFIVKGSQNGGKDLYYRISLIDESGENVMILRNHHYIVNIVGDLYYGQETFEEALEAPATNNVWVSVSDNISAVRDSDYELSVDETSVVIDEDDFHQPNTYYVYYTLTALRGGNLEKPEVSWMDGNNVALSLFTHTFNESTGRGTIEITLNQMGGLQKREGTLFVKSGRLSRKIKIITVKEQNFEPAWITTNVYGVETGENITMMFTVSEECPAELFPMEVLISVDALDIRSESGMVLPVRMKGEEGYGEDNGIGYKYVLNVTGTGQQRIYLETILKHEEGNTIDVTIEAEHFRSLTKTATFQHKVNKWILLHNLRSYSAHTPADEVIYYYLVPQKVGAVVEFPTHLGIVYDNLQDARRAGYRDGISGWAVIENQKGTSYAQYIVPDAKDEFLFYSKYLSHDETAENLDFTFYEVDESLWSTGGRVYGFKRNMDGTQGSGAIYHMVTNSPKSAEVVRIASNPVGSPSVTGSGNCEGGQYRSAIFELANYHPFHFAATVNGVGSEVTGETEEAVDNIQLSYLPGQDVIVEFDVTSFTSSIRGDDGNVLPMSEQISVDPFGTAFDIYIDAPMLDIDTNDPLYQSGKVEEDENIPGRYVYHVDADRGEERNSGSLAARTEDVKATVSQSGERKSIRFKSRNIVSAGDLTISSDDTKVVFYQKKFRIQNASMKGTIRYQQSGGAVMDIPAGSFIPFEEVSRYNRIGTVAVFEGGNFELHLREEYKYDWDTDNVKFQFNHDGVIYEKEFDSLDDLFNSLDSDIILTPVQANN